MTAGRGLHRACPAAGSGTARSARPAATAAAVPARRPRLHPLLPGAARGAGRQPPGDLLRPARLRPADRPDDVSLWTVDRFVEELAQVRAALGLDDLHLFGSSWGGMLAMQYVLDRQPRPAQPDPVRQPGQHDPLGQRLRRAARCPAGRSPPGHPRARGRPASPPAPSTRPPSSASTASTSAAWTRGRPGLERSFAEAGYQVYNTMNGPSEFTVTGTLKTWDIMDRLGEITVPTLLVGGRYDECTPGHLAEMHSRIPGSQLRDHRGCLPPVLRRTARRIQRDHQFIFRPNGPWFRPLSPCVPARCRSNRASPHNMSLDIHFASTTGTWDFMSS